MKSKSHVMRYRHLGYDLRSALVSYLTRVVGLNQTAGSCNRTVEPEGRTGMRRPAEARTAAINWFCRSRREC
jgi:hypothetical protein